MLRVFTKEADTEHDIHPLLRRRWSPRAYSDQPVEPEKLLRIFEAARWSPSSSNLQPWSFIIGFKGDDTYAKIFDTLVEFNQIWSINAPVLVLSVGCKIRPGKEEINESYRYDVGQAVAHLSIQAMEEGLYVHQMGGFDPAKAVRLFDIPAMYNPITAFTIGYIGDAAILPERMAESEVKKRERKSISTFVFSGTYGQAAPLVSGNQS